MNIFLKELAKIFKWQNVDNLSKQSDVCDSDESFKTEEYNWFQKISKVISN